MWPDCTWCLWCICVGVTSAVKVSGNTKVVVVVIIIGLVYSYRLTFWAWIVYMHGYRPLIITSVEFMLSVTLIVNIVTSKITLLNQWYNATAAYEYSYMYPLSIFFWFNSYHAFLQWVPIFTMGSPHYPQNFMTVDGDYVLDICSERDFDDHGCSKVNEIFSTTIDGWSELIGRMTLSSLSSAHAHCFILPNSELSKVSNRGPFERMWLR